MSETKRKIKADTKLAKGTKGCIIRGGNDKLYFRVYDEQHNFVDYELRHSDLEIEIVDPDSVFYKFENGNAVIDHKPETLGVEVEKI